MLSRILKKKCLFKTNKKLKNMKTNKIRVNRIKLGDIKICTSALMEWILDKVLGCYLIFTYLLFGKLSACICLLFFGLNFLYINVFSSNIVRFFILCRKWRWTISLNDTFIDVIVTLHDIFSIGQYLWMYLKNIMHLYHAEENN